MDFTDEKVIRGCRPTLKFMLYNCIILLVEEFSLTWYCPGSAVENLDQELSNSDCTNQCKRERHCHNQPKWDGQKVTHPSFKRQNQNRIDCQRKRNYSKDW
jgi:hypothetical protein